MTSPESPIFDFYPTEFKIDLIGKKFSSQGVALLPFVDEKLLIKTLDDVYHTLSEDEKLRNSTGPNRLFVGKRHPLFQALVGVYNAGKQGNFKGWNDVDSVISRQRIEEMATN